MAGRDRKRQNGPDGDLHRSNLDSEPSMGGSQGTPEEAREASSKRSEESSSEEGGYGADSGYSDGLPTSNDPGRVNHESKPDSNRNEVNARQPSGTDRQSNKPNRTGQSRQSDSNGGRSGSH